MMDYIHTSLPTILAGLVVIVISLHAVYRARREAHRRGQENGTQSHGKNRCTSILELRKQL